jgi:hypothetical protein
MGKVTGRRLFKLEWAAFDARHRRGRIGAAAAKRGLRWSDVLADLRRDTILYALGFWPQRERQYAMQLGCSPAELRRQNKQLAAGEDPAVQAADGTVPRSCGGDQTHAV